MSDNKILALASRVKDKRERLGYSLRRLSEAVGVGFSTLSRLERHEGRPDHNTIVRLLSWLGDDGDDLNFEVQEVALVHFRVDKNVDGRIVHAMVQVARHITSEFKEENF